MKNSFHKGIKTFSVFFLGSIFIGFLFIHNIHDFLSPNKPIKAQILVIEGWLPDYALKTIADNISSNSYYLVITIGGPLMRGSFLSEYKSFANVAKATLENILKKNDIIAIPVPLNRYDRTYASAVALKKWLNEKNIEYNKINIASLDIHARRTWLLFQKALGKKYFIGINAIDDINYDGYKWWSSSYGFKKVIGETIAYLYTKFFFPFSNSFSPII